MFCCKGFGDENIDNLCNFNIFTKLHVWLLYTYQGIIHINLFCALGYHHLISNYIPDNYYMNLILTTIKYIVRILNKSNSNLKKYNTIFHFYIGNFECKIVNYFLYETNDCRL